MLRSAVALVVLGLASGLQVAGAAEELTIVPDEP